MFVSGCLIACSSRQPAPQAPKAAAEPPAKEAAAPPPPPPPPPAPAKQPNQAAKDETPSAKDNPAPGLREIFPHIRADIAARLIEFDGTVPIDCHDPRTPRVYLEVTVCTPDTKEHETLVVTQAKPSHVHAALLAAGFNPGSPGSWTWDEKKLTAHPPKGDALEVTIAYKDKSGTEIESPAISWIVNADNGARFGTGKTAGAFVFAGSGMVKRQGREWYDADGSGLLIGLCTFGSESVAWNDVISPDSEVEEPEWIADSNLVPEFGTPVVVRLRPAQRTN